MMKVPSSQANSPASITHHIEPVHDMSFLRVLEQMKIQLCKKKNEGREGRRKRPAVPSGEDRKPDSRKRRKSSVRLGVIKFIARC